MAKKAQGFAEERQASLIPDPFMARSARFEDAHTDGPGDRLKIGPGGRVVIPAEMRQAMGAAEGDTLLASLVDGELRLLSTRSAVMRAQAMVRQFIPPGGPSVVDELIADRRREQALENEKNN